MKKIYLQTLMIIATLPMFSQPAYMDVNFIKALVVPNGLFFHDSTVGFLGGAAFEAYKDSGTFSIYSTSLWYSGVSTSDSNYKGAYGTFPKNYYFSNGPLSNLNNPGSTPTKRPYGAATLLPSVAQQYKKVFVVTKMQVDSFQAWYNCGLDPTCNQTVNFPGYAIPNAILNWPGNGDISLQQDQFLAPFIDKNSDGLYNPNDGDYPCIKGDKYAFFVMNDVNTKIPVANNIKTEIRVGVYAFDTLINSPLSRTIFVEYDLINRGTDSIIDFYTSAFADIDIGCAANDYVGTFVSEKTVFGYNGNSIDNGCSSFFSPYGQQPPAQGITFLNDSLYSSRMYPSIFSGGIPDSVEQVHTTQMGKWEDGQNLFVGGDGYPGNPGVTSIVTRYHYPYDSIPGQPYWTEHTEMNVVGERRIIGSSGPYIFGPGETIELDLAYTFSKSDTGDHLSSVDLLRNEIGIVQNYYDNKIPKNCYMSTGGSVGVEEFMLSKLQVYPNPASSIITIDFNGIKVKEVSLLSIDGSLLKSMVPTNNKANINLSGFESGIYLVKITTLNKRVITKRVIKN